ncbi:NADP-dependent aldehyde dehydrogenase [Noviherbaspirillum humi]|uniref:2,5-dioxovalerate dehydrogenase n=1 Tax=Noviherbaspirillum humi TaxID=1688639 RepID=A0A239ITA6_9BURK|nr:aldehyde dehydrogenase (NADP(+)) [Noviherbaspirillum humi]SNS95654.1 NADP-dependent aldehyde dehydrogenase [Noviherbaspirillum humi]
MLNGEMFIGAAAVRGEHGSVRGYNPATGEDLEPAYGLASAAEVDRACALAWAAFDTYRDTPLEQRAAFLERIAQNILDLGDALVERAMAESGLPRARIEGERGRTVGQLRLFAEVVREGSWLEVRLDSAQPQRQPLPRSDLRQRHIAVGPVAVFGASNFPLAFSVAGGDTASALAAGCPVVVKAHSAHPGTSELVGRAIRDAAAQCGMPEGVFSLLFAERDNAVKLVTDWRIKSVGFTGSRGGGMSLVRACAGRPEPIPVFAEMSSINPVFLLPAALKERAESIGKNFIASLTMGAGQFCTNPGLVLTLEGPETDAFLRSASAALEASAGATMLTAGIHRAYEQGVAKIAANEQVKTIARGTAGTTKHACQGGLFLATAADFLADPEMQEEIFGAASLVVACKNLDEMRAVAERLEGQLTATIQMEAEDEAIARSLLPTLERKAGRILVNGYPTGVEVCHAMVHGGPFPATSDARMTSVGTLAIRRFLRPVCYQDLPQALLPQALRDDNPLQLPRRLDGRLALPEQGKA